MNTNFKSNSNSNSKSTKYISFVLIGLVMIFIFSYFIIKLVPDLSNDTTKILDISNGWQYRLQDASDKNTMPKWDFTNFEDIEWKDYTLKGERVKPNQNNIAWFRIKLPKNIWTNPSIYFDAILSDDIIVYKNGKKLFNLNNGKVNTIINKLIAINRIVVPLGNYDDDTVLVMKVVSHSGIIGPRTYSSIGSNNNIIKHLFKRELGNILLGFFLILLGLFMLPNIVFLNKTEYKTLLFLCLFTISLGFWLLTSTQNFNMLIVNNNAMRIQLNIFSKYSLIMLMFLFVKEIFVFKSKLINYSINISIVLYIFIYLVVGVLSVNNGALVNKVEIFSYAIMAFNFVLLIFLIVRNAISGNGDAKIFTNGLILFLGLGSYEMVMYITYSIIPSYYKWGILIFIAALILILGRRFSDAHEKLVIYSNELEEKNMQLSKTLEELNNSKNEVQLLNKSLEKKVEERTQELQTAMEKLLRTQEQLIQSEKMAALGGLVAGIAHEINTPVGVSITAVSHLEKENNSLNEIYKLNKVKKIDFENYIEISKELTDVITTNLRNASNLIKSFKKVAVDQSTEEKRGFIIKEYIGEVLLSLSPEIKKTSHSIEVNCPNDLYLYGYPGAFSQIITNLIINTLQHAYEEGVAGILSFYVTKKEKHIEIIFRDNGIGIPKENMNKLFEPFFTTNRSNGGTGLGLNVVYNIVTQKFGGAIRCESEIGNGTDFIIEIPV